MRRKCAANLTRHPAAAQFSFPEAASWLKNGLCIEGVSLISFQEHAVSAAQPSGNYEVEYEVTEALSTLSNPNIALTRQITPSHGDHEDLIFLQ